VAGVKKIYAFIKYFSRTGERYIIDIIEFLKNILLNVKKGYEIEIFETLLRNFSNFLNSECKIRTSFFTVAY